MSEVEILVGIHHERPDGSIVRSYGAGPDYVLWYDNDRNYGKATHAEYATWKHRRDLKDFPNARDPLLPYVFDLYWDIKYLSELRRAVQDEWFEDRAELLKQIEKHPEVKELLR